ncbi:hypothetical protein BST27_14095 [Mycobacterium intermedium]|uniref:Uncharacterized protein n=1 Tax=Mycobacterium intermedium TaxID=28445 RepID=A0A1X0FSC4_MYCIE|nr:hypothetical protein BST27_14095 [Mycobacterium intermedium]
MVSTRIPQPPRLEGEAVTVSQPSWFPLFNPAAGPSGIRNTGVLDLASSSIFSPLNNFSQ